MRRALVAICLAALVVPAAAQAKDYFHTKGGKADRLEERVSSYRIKHGEFLLYNAFNLYAGSYTINRGNYEEGKYTTLLDGVPYSEWIDPVLAPDNQIFNALVRSIRCYGRPWTPRQVLGRWKHKKFYRRVLLSPLATSVGVHAVQLKRSKGHFKGKGECTLYSLVIAS